MINKSPTFQYWDTVLHMEIMGLIFVRAHREQNFPLHVETLKALVPCFFRPGSPQLCQVDHNSDL